MKPKPEKMWAISGVWHMNNKPFLYTGTALTREAMIERHCKELGQSWKKCQKIGDRAVKVLVTPL
jgi:hypothetical protein